MLAFLHCSLDYINCVSQLHQHSQLSSNEQGALQSRPASPAATLSRGAATFDKRLTSTAAPLYYQHQSQAPSYALVLYHNANLSRSCRSRSCNFSNTSCFFNNSFLRDTTSVWSASTVDWPSSSDASWDMEVVRPLLVTQLRTPSGDEQDSMTYFPIHSAFLRKISNCTKWRVGSTN